MTPKINPGSHRQLHGRLSWVLIPGGSLGPQGQGKGSNSLHILPPGISCVSLARLILSWVCKSRTGSSGAASFHRSDIDNLLNLNSQPASAHRRKCLTASGRRITHLIPGPAYGCQSLVVKVRKMPSRTTIVQRQWDLGSVGAGKRALVNLSFQPKRERKLASRGGGWALRAQASVVNKIIFFI